jgi:hypothetical protein
VLFLDPSKEVKHSRFRASTAICLHAFYLFLKKNTFSTSSTPPITSAKGFQKI